MGCVRTSTRVLHAEVIRPLTTPPQEGEWRGAYVREQAIAPLPLPSRLSHTEEHGNNFKEWPENICANVLSFSDFRYPLAIHIRTFFTFALVTLIILSRALICSIFLFGNSGCT